MAGRSDSQGSTQESPLSVAIISPHPMFRDLLCAALQLRGHRSTLAPIAPFAEMSRAVHGCDAGIVFSSEPSLDGHRITRSLLARDPTLRIVVIEYTADITASQKAIRSGAIASIGCRASLEDGLNIVERAARGDSTFGYCSERSIQAPDAHSGAGMSVREHEILQLIVDGLDIRQIAARLILSAKTVKHHLSSIYSKLGAPNRTTAVVEGLRRGIVDLHCPSNQGDA